MYYFMTVQLQYMFVQFSINVHMNIVLHVHISYYSGIMFNVFTDPVTHYY